MFRYRFFKHGAVWRCVEKGSDKAQEINTAILEGVLGVVGGPEVIVVAEQPDRRKFHITVKNGFIEKVEYLFEENAYFDEGTEYERAYIKTSSAEQTEFHIKDSV